MSPHTGRPQAAPPPQTRLLTRRRMAAALACAALIVYAAFLRRAEPSRPNALESYVKEVATLEREYRRFHGRLMREPELETQFQSAAELVAATNYLGAIEILEKISGKAGVPVVFHNLGTLYAAAGDRGRAIAAFREAITRDPENALVREAIDRLRLASADETTPVRQENEPNNSEVVANLISLARTVDGEIEPGDSDTFRFITPAAPRDILQLDVENVDGTLEMGIRMHDGEMTKDTARVIAPKGEPLRRFVSQPPNKALYLQLWGAQRSVGKYRIVVNPLRSFDALEPNDDIYSARKIQVGQTIEANIMDSEDTDFYSFQSPRNGTVTIELKNESDALIPALTTFNTDRRNTGFGPDVRRPGAGLTHTMEVVDFQTYYVQVWPQALSSGKYSLVIR